MDTTTFLVTRDGVMARLANRRQVTLNALAEKHNHNGSLFSSGVPFWLRLAFNAFLPKRFGSFWPQALLTAAPVVYGLAKNVTSQFRREPSKWGGILSFLPLVKTLIKRYN
jgi:hypothetical protein